MTNSEAIEVLELHRPFKSENPSFSESQFQTALDTAIEALQEPPIGHWTDREVFTNDESPVEEWQSCCCSECGRYDTRPYMYFFKAPNYCSWCGAKMEVKE